MHGQSSDFPISNEVLSDGGLYGSIQFHMLCVFMAAIGFHFPICCKCNSKELSLKCAAQKF